MTPDADPFAPTEFDPDEQPTLDGAEPATVRRRFGRFRVISRVGAGGMGEVYVAWDPRLDRKVAIKVLTGPSRPGVSRERLVREAKAMARLSHPNIVPIYEVDVEGDDLFIVMEFVDGPTLRQWLDERPRSLREIFRIFAAAGRGLAAAHDAGIVHRDFKPDNVLIGGDGRPRVADFGVVRIADAQGLRLQTGDITRVSALAALNADVTRSGAMIGTPAYMSPEQFSAGEISAATDQFSFCVALWEAIYRQRPFFGEDLYTLIGSVSSGKVAPPPAGSEVPDGMRIVLERGMASDPKDRWPSIAELLLALTRGAEPKLSWRVVVAAILLAGALIVVALVVARGGTRVVSRDDKEEVRSEAAVVVNGSLTLEVRPDDAEVRVDGRRYSGGSPRVIGSLAPGRHTIEVSKGEDYLTFTDEIDIAEGTPLSLPVTLPIRVVALTVLTEPAGAAVSILEGETRTPIGTGGDTFRLVRKPKARYAVEASFDGYVTDKAPITFSGEASQRLKIALVKDPRLEVQPTPPDDVEARTATLMIGCQPGLPPATVWVDGKKLNKPTVATTRVGPGPHTIKWKWPDGTSSVQKISVGDGEKMTIKGAP